MFPIEITRDGRMQMNYVFQDVGEVEKLYLWFIRKFEFRLWRLKFNYYRIKKWD
jgi:hypothetical protein